jgi:hypothetical protein
MVAGLSPARAPRLADNTTRWIGRRREGVLCVAAARDPAKARPVVARSSRSRFARRRRDHSSLGPENDRATDDRVSRQRTEIASVERVGGPRDHQQDVAFDAAALPNRQRAVAAGAQLDSPISIASPGGATVDSEDRWSGKRRHMLRHWHAARRTNHGPQGNGQGVRPVSQQTDRRRERP